jgi:beta-glucosidase-like glycosyl hydrolase
MELDRAHQHIDQRLQRQLAAIEAGVDAVLVGDRIRALKAERQQVELAIANIDDARHRQTGLDLTCAVLDGLPNLHNALAAADPKVRRQVYDAFRLSVEIDRNQAQIRLKALISSAFTEATDLEALVAHKAIAGGRYALTGDRAISVQWAAEWR